MSIIIEEQPIDLTIIKKDSYPNLRNALSRFGMKVRHRSLQSDNYSPGTTGWIIRANGTIEALDIIAGNYVSSFVQDAVPTSLHIGDLWIKTDDNNNVYRAESVGADEIAVGEWVKYGILANWSEIVDDDTHKPADDATEGGTIGTNVRDEDDDVLTQKLVVNFEKFEAGEDIVAKNTLCIKPAIVNISPSADIYTDEALPDTNYDEADPLIIGRSAANKIYEIFIKFNMGSVPSNLVKAELVLQTSGAIIGNPVFHTARCTSDFSEDTTVTYNNKPTVISTSDGAHRDGIPDVDAATEVVIDVTNLVRNWQSGRYDNYGMKIWSTVATADNRMTLFAQENGTAANRPILRCYDGGDSDGKVYKTDVRDYILTRNYIGVALNTDVTGNTIKVQRQGKAPITITIGQNAYLSSTPGGITASTVNLDRILKIGQGNASNELLMEKNDMGMLIEKRHITVPDTSPTEYVGCPDEAKKVVIYALIGSGQALETRLQTILHRGADNQDGMTRTYTRDRYDTLAAQYYGLTVTWLSSGNEIILDPTVTNKTVSYDIYFFK